MSINTDPSFPIQCERCNLFTMTRRVTRGFFGGLKTYAGDWFKKQYGHDIGERDANYASEQAALDKQVKELKKDYGINVQEKAKEVPKSS